MKTAAAIQPHCAVLTATIFSLFGAMTTLAQVPNATITGPIAAVAPGDPSRNSIYNASAIDLTTRGYVEEEYFIEGTANRYTTEEFETGQIEDTGHSYRTRFIVRRPPAASFNGTVVIEWLNVTGGTDKDIDWWQSGPHLIRNGYAFIAVSAQREGIDSLKTWSPNRYGSLDVTHEGMVTNDALSYDIFSAIAKAVNRQGETTAASTVDIMAGLKADKIVATGHSQSAGRLATYLNNVHPLEPLFDGVIVHGGGGQIRDDQEVKIFKLMAETDMPRRAADPQPDSDYFRQWEVAGSSHVDILFELEYARERALADGAPLSMVSERNPGCELPAYSRVPFRDVMDAAFEHMQIWIADGTPPPKAQPLAVARMLPELQFARDGLGNVLGGIRLAEHAVPTAKNTGMNGGGNRFCFLYGSHEPFDQATLQRLYPSHAAYVDAVRVVAEQNVADGFILPYAAEQTIRNAELSTVGR